MRASADLLSTRREEIIAACRKLYESMSYREITIKEIAEETSFSRPSIYNYFETKEEIFLALFGKEYELFSEDLDRLCSENERLSLDELASALAQALEKRMMLLKLLSMNLYDTESNSRMERLVEFKASYGKSKDALDRCLQKFCPQFEEKTRQTFLYALLPFVYGLYPYTMVTEKQKQALDAAQVSYVYMSPYEMAYSGIRTLLGGLQ
ncbi:MAG: TetR family transcriptional regulator [Oscillospiraceae bacterium]|nr:TetR family transcriptional regulator [Oscillospiraceae bacterium]